MVVNATEMRMSKTLSWLPEGREMCIRIRKTIKIQNRNREICFILGVTGSHGLTIGVTDSQVAGGRSVKTLQKK